MRDFQHDVHTGEGFNLPGLTTCPIALANGTPSITGSAAGKPVKPGASSGKGCTRVTVKRPPMCSLMARPELPGLQYAALDKAYDSDHIRARIKADGLEAVIPPKANHKVSMPCDAQQYRLREKAERFFGHLKQYRRIATRYDKLSCTFLAFIHVVAAWISIK